MLRTRLLGSLLAAVLALTGCGLVGEGSRGPIVVTQTSPPAAQAQVAEPAEITIPRIGAHSTLIPLGLNADGSIQVPDVHEPLQGGYYARAGAKAGQPGPPLVVLGHVNGDRQTGLLYRLKDLRAGDPVLIKLADRTVLTFRITNVDSEPKTAFPAQKVFGPVDHGTLRLVTCGGTFDPRQRSYLSNIIAYADLVVA